MGEKQNQPTTPFLHPSTHANLRPTKAIQPALFDSCSPPSEPVPPRRGFCRIWASRTLGKPLFTVADQGEDSEVGDPENSDY
jgi:hypothetical protein